jgi:hypothetical protein
MNQERLRYLRERDRFHKEQYESNFNKQKTPTGRRSILQRIFSKKSTVSSPYGWGVGGILIRLLAKIARKSRDGISN